MTHAHPATALRAGVAISDITPPVGHRMSGYFTERFSTGVHDALLAKALYLEQGEARFALVVGDLIGVPARLTATVRRRVAARTGIPPANLVVAATHCHTGPLYYGALREYFHERAIERHGHDPHEPYDYAAQLADRMVDAIVRAQRAARPARLAAGVAQETRLSFNRRFHMRDGTVRFNPGKLNPDIVRPAGPIDPEVGLVAIRAAEGDRLIATLTVFALHLDTVGGTEYAADFPYYLERELRARFGSRLVSLFAAGTCGDINHIDVTHDRPQKGYAEAQRIGSALAATVAAALRTLPEIEAPRLAVRRERVSVPLQEYPPEVVRQSRERLALIGTRELPFLDQVHAYRVVSLQRMPRGSLPLDVQAIRLSDRVALVTLPGEVFVELGLAIKRDSPFPTTMVMELCNDSPAYIPTRKAFAEGSYETVNSRVRSGGGEMLVEAAGRLLRALAADR